MLENGADLYVNERQKIRLSRGRKKKEECQITIFYFAQCVSKLHYYSEIPYIASPVGGPCDPCSP